MKKKKKIMIHKKKKEKKKILRMIKFYKANHHHHHHLHLHLNHKSSYLIIAPHMINQIVIKKIKKIKKKNKISKIKRIYTNKNSSLNKNITGSKSLKIMMIKIKSSPIMFNKMEIEW